MSVRFRPTSEPSRISSPRDTAPGRAWQTLPHIQQLRPDGAGPSYRNGAYNCAPTVVAMVARGLGKAGRMQDAQLIEQLGRGIVNAEGTTPRGVARMLARVGVPLGGPALGGKYQDAALQAHLDKGHKLIAQVQSLDPRTNQASAHYVLVRERTPEGNYVVSDPLAEAPYVVTPEQLRTAVQGAPPDGGMLIPIGNPRGHQVAPSSLRFAGPRQAPQAPNPNAFRVTDDVFEGADTTFHKPSNPVPARSLQDNERYHEHRLGLTYNEAQGRSRAVKGQQPLTPRGKEGLEFLQRLQALKESGSPEADSLLRQLEASPFERDQRALKRIKKQDQLDPAIGKKLSVESF